MEALTTEKLSRNSRRAANACMSMEDIEEFSQFMHDALHILFPDPKEFELFIETSKQLNKMSPYNKQSLVSRVWKRIRSFFYI